MIGPRALTCQRATAPGRCRVPFNAWQLSAVICERADEKYSIVLMRRNIFLSAVGVHRGDSLIEEVEYVVNSDRRQFYGSMNVCSHHWSVFFILDTFRRREGRISLALKNAI
jgi:hypothetical protein